MQSNEILAVVDSVSTEKGLDKDVIFKAIEIAIASASQRHFHEDADLFVRIDRATGEYSTHRNWIVFDDNKSWSEKLLLYLYKKKLSSNGIIDIKKLF